jgi:nitroreductase
MRMNLSKTGFTKPLHSFLVFERIAALESRDTYRAYDPSYTIPWTQIETIVRLALLSPTGRDVQDLDIVAIVNREKLEEVSSVVLAGWPESISGPRASRVLPLGVKNILTCDASALLAIVRNERSTETAWADFDAGVMAMSVMVAARDFDLHTMLLGLICRSDKAKVEAALGVPEGSLVIAIALGKALGDSEVKLNKAIRAKGTIID